jgi:hypothetical protein
MLSLFRPSFEVVKEGRILNNQQSSPGQIWLLLGHFQGMVSKDDWKEMIFCQKPLKHQFGRIILQRFV